MVEVGRFTVGLAPGASQDLSVEVVAGGWGNYQVNVDGLTGWIQVSVAEGESFVGGVVKQQGGGALAGATVTIGQYSTQTGSDGYFLIAVPYGTYTLTASFPGYISKSVQVEVVPGSNTSVPTIYLAPEMTGISKIRSITVNNILVWSGSQLYVPQVPLEYGGWVAAYVNKQSKYWRLGPDMEVEIPYVAYTPSFPSGASKVFLNTLGSGLDYKQWKLTFQGLQETEMLFQQPGGYYGKVPLYSSPDNVNWTLTDTVSFTLAEAS